MLRGRQWGRQFASIAAQINKSLAEANKPDTGEKHTTVGMRTALALLLLAVSLSACGMTTVDLADKPAEASWQFSGDLESVSSCLMRALNAEGQPKTAAGQFWGRSVLHSIVAVEPGGVNHVVHEHIAPTTIYLLVVRNDSPRGAIASAHVNDMAASKYFSMVERAAATCSGSKSSAEISPTGNTVG
jgi:hypothetical protein